jgi:hypothetical protein
MGASAPIGGGQERRKGVEDDGGFTEALGLN